MQGFIILGRIDYNYTFYRLECIATLDGNSLLKQETISIIFNYHFHNSPPSPIPMPPKIQYDSTNVTNLISPEIPV